MGLRLTISTKNNEYSRLFDSSTQEEDLTVTLKGIGCTVSLVNLTFNKQMYQPGKIVAKLQFTASGITQDANDKSYFLLNRDSLQDEFLDALVTLEDESNDANHPMVIAQSYKVYEVRPYYTSQSLYVELIIYSPDIQLTEDIGCATYTAKKLGSDIFTGKLSSYSDIQAEVALHCGLKNGDGEYIQPYLVRYQETFHDFLIRTANRWGEFVYFEEGERAKKYYAKLPQNETVMDEAKQFLNKAFKGKLGLMINTLIEDEDFTDLELDELYAILDKKRSKKG